MNHSLYITLIAGAMTLSACSTSAKESKTATDSLRSKLEYAVNTHKVMYGHHDDPVYGHTWVGDEGRSDVKEIVGDYPAVMSWDLGGLELNDSLNLDGVSFERMRKEVAAQNARGGINTFSWHLRNPVNGGDSWNVEDSLIVHKIATDPTIRAKYDQQLHNVAAFFNSLKDGNGNKIAVIFRPWHEHTGNWFWWGKDHSTVEGYKFLWQEMRSVFDADGVDNVLWAYSPDKIQNETQYMERYPGDKYVDILGVDVYHFGGEEGVEAYKSNVTTALNIVSKLAKEHNKIPALTETGLESLTISDWYTSILLPTIKQAPAISYLVVWRNAHDNPTHFYAPYKGHAAEKSFIDFYNDEMTIFAKGVKSAK
jgi:mannan endo-1,4-beta-mannosidase